LYVLTNPLVPLNLLKMRIVFLDERLQYVS
jgi:hypothetical protein